VIGSKAKPGLGPVPQTAADALFALHNNPHPLDMLGNSAAYGPNGQISRWVAVRAGLLLRHAAFVGW